jgi:DNA-binding NarL/FixJ family response regulator
VRPLVVIEGPPSAFAAALGDARHAGHKLIESFDGRDGVVCCGEIADPATAESAMLAAVSGAGLIVRVTATREVTDRLLDDLRRLGPVEHRLGETARLSLTTEQRALLDLLSNGTTLGSAAAQLRLSRRTADRRLAEARRVLGAATTAEALVAYSSRR